MHEVQIDVEDRRRGVGFGTHLMRIPDFVEKCRAHYAASISKMACCFGAVSRIGVSQPRVSGVLPSNRPKKAFCSARVISPGLPAPTGLRSTERTGVISAAVPV